MPSPGRNGDFWDSETGGTLSARPPQSMAGSSATSGPPPGMSEGGDLDVVPALGFSPACRRTPIEVNTPPEKTQGWTTSRSPPSEPGGGPKLPTIRPLIAVASPNRVPPSPKSWNLPFDQAKACFFPVGGRTDSDYPFRVADAEALGHLAAEGADILHHPVLVHEGVGVAGLGVGPPHDDPVLVDVGGPAVPASQGAEVLLHPVLASVLPAPPRTAACCTPPPRRHH